MYETSMCMCYTTRDLGPDMLYSIFETPSVLGPLLCVSGPYLYSISGWTAEEKKHLGQELSDVLIYLVRLAEECKVDLPAAVLDKFKLNAVKYPPGKESQAKLKYSSCEANSTNGMNGSANGTND